MILQFVASDGMPWAVLPPSIHTASLDEVGSRYAIKTRRRVLFEGGVDATGRLRSAGCARIYLDGSRVTPKPLPEDFDVCWDPSGVDQERLDPVFRDLSNLRAAQKAEFKGEFFPTSLTCTDIGRPFLDFFQIERVTHREKGIIAIHIARDPLLLGRETP